MNSRRYLHALVCGGLLTIAAAPSASAEGTFDIPAGAHFNRAKLAKIGEFFRNEVTTGKIAGASGHRRRFPERLVHLSGPQTSVHGLQLAC